MENIINSLNEPINQLIALGAVLVFYAICYSVRLAGGHRRVKKQKTEWSWERFWNDLHFRLLMVYALAATVIAVDMAQWLSPLLGFNISDDLALLLNANLIITVPFVAGLNELQKGVKLLWKVWRYKESLDALSMSLDDYDSSMVNTAKIANSTKEFIGALASSINSIQESPEAIAGEVLTKVATKKLAEMGSIPYYKINISTPAEAYKNLLGKGFNEGWGLQCVAGFKEFMFSLCRRYVAAGGAASGYAYEPARSAVCKLGFTWHDGPEGLQDGDWGIWTNVLYGHVAMYYQRKWLGQNQGAADGNAGNAFNLMALPMQGFAGYFRPNIYMTSQEAGQETTQVSTQVTAQLKAGDKVNVTKYVDANGAKLMKLQKTPYLVYQVRNSDRTAVLKSDDGDIYARMSFDNIKKVN